MKEGHNQFVTTAMSELLQQKMMDSTEITYVALKGS